MQGTYAVEALLCQYRVTPNWLKAVIILDVPDAVRQKAVKSLPMLLLSKVQLAEVGISSSSICLAHVTRLHGLYGHRTPVSSSSPR